MTNSRIPAAPLAVVLLCGTLWGSAIPAAAQSAHRAEGVVGAGLLIRQLDGTKRVLMIGAHPDDEETSLLAAMALARGARTAYLALNRGEGGQNLIGPEMGEGLGLIRTGELVAARELDGGEQYFTRTYDFGYTKTAEESLSLWGGDEVLADVVSRIREFRPHVIVSVFSGTPQDGHGQHQVAGLMARAAFDAAGDPSRFPEQIAGGLEPWQPSKLYRALWRDPGATTLRIDTGALDPLLGRSYYQVSMNSRSQHASQDMGRAQALGPQQTNVALLESRVEVEEPEHDLFAGVDTALASLAAGIPGDVGEEVGAGVATYREAVRSAASSLSALDPTAAAAPLASAVLDARRIVSVLEGAGLANHELARVMARRDSLASLALAATAGIGLDARTGDDLVVPGQAVSLEGELWNGGPFVVAGASAYLDRPNGWEVTWAGTDAADLLEGGTMARWVGEVLVPEEADPSVPYFLRRPREGDRYRWPDGLEFAGHPFDPPLLIGRFEFTLRVPRDGDFGGDVPLVLRRPATFRGVDKALGEFRKPVLVIPALTLDPRPAQMVWPLGETDPRPVSVRVRGESPEPVNASVRLTLPPGWGVDPAAQSVRLAGEGSEATVSFEVRPPADLSAGEVTVGVEAVALDGRAFHRNLAVLDYPHIRRNLLPGPDDVRISAFPVDVAPGIRVGYVMGSGDDGADALRQMGVAVEELGPARVLAGDFQELDVLVLGVRAYETRPDLVAANDAVLDFAEGGGVVVVQYNKYEFPSGDFAPYPVAMARPHDRVTDEGSPVEFLDPDSPIFTRPNRITAADFQGWIQERGLYFLSEWDPRYQPLLAMSDPGEEPKRGILMAAPVGNGLYIYTGLAFFRQFPVGVPGAYRLFANLVSQDPAEWSAGAPPQEQP